MFLGTHHPRLDEKGRLFLPARFRDQLAEGLVMTKGQERCLYVYPGTEFTRITESLREAPVTNKPARDFLRVMFAGASDEVPDKQGRITVPPALRAYAGLTRDCTVIGANTRVEIWDSTAWAAYETAQEQSFSEISEGGAARPSVTSSLELGLRVAPSPWHPFPGARRVERTETWVQGRPSTAADSSAGRPNRENGHRRHPQVRQRRS